MNTFTQSNHKFLKILFDPELNNIFNIENVVKFQSLIEKKRPGDEISIDELSSFISYVSGIRVLSKLEENKFIIPLKSGKYQLVADIIPSQTVDDNTARHRVTTHILDIINREWRNSEILPVFKFDIINSRFEAEPSRSEYNKLLDEIDQKIQSIIILNHMPAVVLPREGDSGVIIFALIESSINFFQFFVNYINSLNKDNLFFRSIISLYDYPGDRLEKKDYLTFNAAGHIDIGYDEGIVKQSTYLGGNKEWEEKNIDSLKHGYLLIDGSFPAEFFNKKEKHQFYVKKESLNKSESKEYFFDGYIYKF